MNSESENFRPASEMVEEQMIRSRLRQDYLQIISSFVGKKASALLFDGKSTQGIFAGIRADGSHYLIDNLETPIGVVDHALIRMADTLLISFDASSFFAKPEEE